MPSSGGDFGHCNLFIAVTSNIVIIYKHLLVSLVLVRPFPHLSCSLSIIHRGRAQESKDVFTLALLTGPSRGSLPWYIHFFVVSVLRAMPGIGQVYHAQDHLEEMVW